MHLYLKEAKFKLTTYFDLDYFIKFVVWLVFFYYLNIFLVGITDWHGKLYSPFLGQYLNYAVWTKNGLLYTSKAIAYGFGVDSYISFPYRLTSFNGSYVELAYGCLGFGPMVFWTAYIIAHKETFKRKFLWCVIGLLSIWLINSFRIAVILIAVTKKWRLNSFLDHHTLFNVFAYTIIIFLMYLYARDNKSLEKEQLLIAAKQ